MNSRVNFFFHYLLITLIVIAGLYYLLWFEWYPDFYFSVLYVNKLLIITSACLIFAGPLLALVTYKENFVKDFMVILALQSLVLFFGLKLLYSERPLFLVFSVDRFVIATANSVDQNTLSPLVILDTLEKPSPLTVAAHLPESINLSFMFGVIKGGADVEFLPSLYEPIVNQKNTILSNALDYSMALAANDIQIPDKDSIVYYPLVNPKGEDKLISFDLSKMAIEKVFDIDPWKLNK